MRTAEESKQVDDWLIVWKNKIRKEVQLYRKLTSTASFTEYTLPEKEQPSDEQLMSELKSMGLAVQPLGYRQPRFLEVCNIKKHVNVAQCICIAWHL